MNKNIVMFKRGRDAILVILDPDADFEQLKSVLLSKVGEASRFFGGASSAISFVGRILTEEQENELLDILAENSNLDITFILREDAKKPSEEAANVVAFPGDAVQQASGQESSPSAGYQVKAPEAKRPIVGPLVDLSAKLPPKAGGNKPFDISEHNTKFQHGSLRSGQIIRFRGSVVVLGDVNPGAEILAEGNVIVLGSLKGLVHAGCMGNDRCFICALSLTPSQLRIADKITYMPNDAKDTWGGAPQYAFISDGQIYIAPLVDD